MINTKKVIVVLPAYNASETLQSTYEEIPFDIWYYQQMHKETINE